MHVHVADLASLLGLAAVQSLLVALPRSGALASLDRLRAPAWSALLPGSIALGTALPMWHASLATALVALAAASTPLLALLGIARVARFPHLVLLAAIPAILLGASLDPPLAGQLSSTAATALAALAVGVGLTRLIPSRWLVVGIAVMAVLDALLLVMGVGETAAGAMARASAHFHGPELDHAAIGPSRMDYPDMVLAAALGGAVAGTPVQLRAAATLALIATMTDAFLLIVPIVPATVPVALTLWCLDARQLRPVLTRRSLRRPIRSCRHPAVLTCAACAA